jgi:hypothetical protein
MNKITDLFPLTNEQLHDPIKFGTVFLEQIRSLPGRKIGFIGQPQSGTTVSMHHLSSLPNLHTFYDPRGIPDTFNSTLTHFSDLDGVISSQLPTWMPLIKQAPENHDIGHTKLINSLYTEPDPDLVNKMVAKMSQDVEESRKMLLWKAALNLFCMRDLRVTDSNTNPAAVEIYDLPYFPVDYNQYFDIVILLKRRDTWFTDGAFLEHIATEGVDSAAEQALVSMRDQELADYAQAGNWTFDHQILNDGTVDELKMELDELFSNIVGRV